MTVRMMIDKNFFYHVLPVLSMHYCDRSTFISLQRKGMLMQYHGMRRRYYTAWHGTKASIKNSVTILYVI